MLFMFLVLANVSLSFFLLFWLHCYSWVKLVVWIHSRQTTHRPCLYCLWQATMNPIWPVVTLNLQGALHRLHYPREERRKGFVFYCTCDQNMQKLLLNINQSTVDYTFICKVYQLMQRLVRHCNNVSVLFVCFAENSCHTDNSLHCVTAHVSLPGWWSL